jgi:UDP-glucose 4-epimerase
VVDEPIRTITNNIRGTETVLEEACRYRRRVLVASTSEVYGKSDKEVFREDDDRIMGSTHLSRWSYADSKAIDEFLTLAYWRSKRMPCVVVRLFNTVGPRQTGRYGMVIPRFVRSALLGEPIEVFGDGKQTRCFAYVGDVVPALRSLMENKSINGEIFNIGNTERITIVDLAKRIVALTGSKSEINYIPYDQAYGPGYEDMRHRAPSLDKIRAAIDYRPKTSLDQILESVIEDMKRNPDRAF